MSLQYFLQLQNLFGLALRPLLCVLSAALCLLFKNRLFTCILHVSKAWWQVSFPTPDEVFYWMLLTSVQAKVAYGGVSTVRILTHFYDHNTQELRNSSCGASCHDDRLVHTEQKGISDQGVFSM